MPSGFASTTPTSKALHLLAPKFLPLWDDRIAKAYSCLWDYSDIAADKYLEFMKKSKSMLESIIKSYTEEHRVDRNSATQAICKECSTNLPSTRSLLKILDEYNYSKYTGHWIE